MVVGETLPATGRRPADVRSAA